MGSTDGRQRLRAKVYGQREEAPRHKRNPWFHKHESRHMWVYYYEIHDNHGNLIASDNTCGWRNIYDACLGRMERLESAS